MRRLGFVFSRGISCRMRSRDTPTARDNSAWVIPETALPSFSIF
jgi:hypothetical protein